MTTTTSRPDPDAPPVDDARVQEFLDKAKEMYRVPTGLEGDKPTGWKSVPADTFEPSTFRLQEKVVLLILTMRAPGNERRIKDKEMLRTDADKARIAISKTLIEAKEFKAISKLDSSIRDYIASTALPSPFKAGVYAIPLAMIGTVDDQLQKLADTRRDLVARYASVYEAAVESSRKKLGSQFRQSDYLTPSTLLKAYDLQWQFVSLTAPDQIASLDQRVFKREQEKLRKQWEEAVGDMRDALRVGLSEMVADMVERLQKVESEGGDPKRFKPTKILERFETFFSNVQDRNVTNDTELAEIAAQTREILRGVTTDELKKKKDVRATVTAGMAQVKAQLDKLEISAKGRRKITLPDE